MPTSLDFAALGLDGATARARDPNFARYAAQHAEQREQKLPLALPVESAEPDDLAGVSMERNVAQAVRPVQTFDFDQRDRVRLPRRRLRREDMTELPADHHLDDFVV